MNRFGWTFRLSLALVLAAPAPLLAQGDYVPDARASPDTLAPVRWGFSITPYIWSAGQKGRLAVDGGEANVDLSVGDILDNIKVGLAAAGRGSPGALAGTARLRLPQRRRRRDGREPDGARVHRSGHPAAGNRLHPAGPPLGRVDGLAGARYWHTDAGIDVTEAGTQVAAVSGSRGWVDGTVGARVRYGFAPSVAPHRQGRRGDRSGSDFAWQALGGVGIDVGTCCTALAAYRHLDTDYESDDFVYDAYLSGPTLGFEARF